MKITLTQKKAPFHFEASDGKHSLTMDASETIGGTDAGMRPMAVLLSSLGGCSSIDVISILEKQKQTITHFKVEMEAERADAVPAVFTKIKLTFFIDGTVDASKADRAVNLSMDKYCSVTKMLEPTVEITHAIVLNGNTL